MGIFKSASVLAIVLLAFTGRVHAQEPGTATGTLVIDIKAFHSERELPSKAEQQLKNGGIEWGQRDQQIVFTMVNKRFIDFPVNHMTRYGQSESIQLPAGDYKITGIGLEMKFGFNPQKIVDKGGYVNEDILVVHIEPGKTTTLTIDPVIYKDNAFVVDFWMPTLNATVSVDGGPASPAIALTTRSDKSIVWGTYGGPLKFKSQ